MPFREELPLQCPPQEATDNEIAEAFRMVFRNPPTEEDFLSKKALGHDMLPTSDPCGFASCSLNLDQRKAVKLAELPKPREKGAMVAKVTIPAGAGLWLQNSKHHIHFWMYEGFDPTDAFVEMVHV